MKIKRKLKYSFSGFCQETYGNPDYFLNKGTIYRGLSRFKGILSKQWWSTQEVTRSHCSPWKLRNVGKEWLLVRSRELVQEKPDDGSHTVEPALTEPQKGRKRKENGDKYPDLPCVLSSDLLLVCASLGLISVRRKENQGNTNCSCYPPGTKARARAGSTEQSK